jgi:hypothetical protein
MRTKYKKNFIGLRLNDILMDIVNKESKKQKITKSEWIRSLISNEI